MLEVNKNMKSWRCARMTEFNYIICMHVGEPKIALSSFDPLKIQRMALKQGGESPVNIELIFSNVELHGLRDFVCTSVKWVHTFESIQLESFSTTIN